MNKINTLHRINEIERHCILAAIRLLANNNQSMSWIAKVMLEDDAKFVHNLFWAGERDSQ